MSIFVHINNRSSVSTLVEYKTMEDQIDNLLGYPKEDVQVVFHDSEDFLDCLNCPIIALESDFDDIYGEDDNVKIKFTLVAQKRDDWLYEREGKTQTIVFAYYE